jgi:hypothetical protein
MTFTCCADGPDGRGQAGAGSVVSDGKAAS